MTNGLVVPRHPPPGHPISGSGSEEHLDVAYDLREDGHAPTNSLLRGYDDGGIDGHEPIYADKEARRNGQSTRETAGFRTAISGLKAVLPHVVSLIDLLAYPST